MGYRYISSMESLALLFSRVNFASVYGVFVSLDRWVINLPPRCREDMLVLLIPTSLYNFPWMAFIFLYSGVIYHSYIIVYIEMKQWTGFASCLGDDQIVKCKMLFGHKLYVDIYA